LIKDQFKAAEADTAAQKKQRGIQSVEVGGRLLGALAQQRVPLSLSELASAAQLSSAQAHTYLVSLTRLGLVKRDALTGNYEPGPLSLRLGLMHIERQPAYRIAVPHAAALAETIGYSVAVSVAGAQGPTIVRYERGGFPLHVNLHVGTVMSLEMTSTGRIFSAFLAPERVTAIARSQAANSVRPGRGALGLTVDPADPQWRARLDKIRERGIERGIDVPSPGISSLSVPVLDAEHRMQLALTVIGSSGSIDVNWEGAVARQLLETARRVTDALANSI
jgi:DNA-binding IclR family transcriptional regulator